MKYSIATVLMVLAISVSVARGQSAGDDDVSKLKTFGTAGKELYVLKDGREAELYRRAGAGCLTHMWFGGDWPGYLRTQIRIYADGQQKPSIEMELGLGVGVGFEDPAAPVGIARMGKTGHPSGVYNTFRIPFANGIRVTAQLPDDVKVNPPFWWIIRGTENIPVLIGGVKLPSNARLKLHAHLGRKIRPLEEFDLCDAKGAGALYQVTIAARSEGNFNFLEAQMRAYIDGAREPLMLSSGLEDYFLGTYYFNRGRYYNPAAGLTHMEEKDHSFSAYRFHDDDPIFFKNGLRLTCRCGEKSGDHVFGDPKPTVYSTYAWVYEW